MSRAVIFGCAGLTLTPEERAFFADVQPWGFILFARNIETPDQVRALTASLRDCVGRNAPILIDQEGGRVQRLTAPYWTDFEPPLDAMQSLPADKRAAAMKLRYRLIAHELSDLGIDVNCAPMLDVPTATTHPFLLNRCYSYDPDEVGVLGQAALDGLLAGGVLSIVKHIPGHGRGTVDSHLGLPVVDTDAQTLSDVDFVPFRALKNAPMAMTAHVVYSAFDANHCATLSPHMITVIRGDIGFDGLLMTDDLSMHALSGTFEQRVLASLDAGCDMILHCNGDMGEMAEIAAATPMLNSHALRRADAALAERASPQPFDAKAARTALRHD